jgi:hypothetical protein
MLASTQSDTSILLAIPQNNKRICKNDRLVTFGNSNPLSEIISVQIYLIDFLLNATLILSFFTGLIP